MNNKIGVILESFKCEFAEAIKQSAEIGVNGIQFYGIHGELDCDKISLQKKTILKEMLKNYNLEVTAICADMGGHGFENSNYNNEKIAKTCRVMDLAKDMGCSIITTHIGVITDIDSTTRQAQKVACEKIGTYGEKIDVKLAIETGSESCETLKSFLDELKTKNVGVNFDPANLVMVTGDDPVKGVYTLKDYIVHTHAKDGIMKMKTDPKIIYDYFAQGGIENMNLDKYFIETSLGNGMVDFHGWLSALNKVGYTGFLTIERETSNDPYMDIYLAVNFLRNKMNICNNK